MRCFQGLPGGGYRWRAFPSDSSYDDLAWAGVWLYKATGEGSLLTRARSQLAALANCWLGLEQSSARLSAAAAGPPPKLLPSRAQGSGLT